MHPAPRPTHRHQQPCPLFRGSRGSALHSSASCSVLSRSRSRWPSRAHSRPVIEAQAGHWLAPTRRPRRFRRRHKIRQPPPAATPRPTGSLSFRFSRSLSLIQPPRPSRPRIPPPKRSQSPPTGPTSGPLPPPRPPQGLQNSKFRFGASTTTPKIPKTKKFRPHQRNHQSRAPRLRKLQRNTPSG